MIVSVIVLAAGRSERMGVPKLTLPYRGKPLLQATLERVFQAEADEFLVVIPEGDEALHSTLKHLPIRIVEVPAGGTMANSIAVGVRSARVDADAFLIALGDMPDIEATSFQTLLSEARPERIVIPSFGERRGNPVVFGRSFRKELEDLTGDRSGRKLYEEHREAIIDVSVGDPGILRDIDRPEDLKN